MDKTDKAVHDRLQALREAYLAKLPDRIADIERQWEAMGERWEPKVAKSLHRVQFAVMPRPLKELQHQDLHAIPNGAQSGAHGGSGLALASAGVHDDEAFSDVAHVRSIHPE